MGYLIHVLLHFLVGASFFYLFFSRRVETFKNRSIILSFGGIAAISPDVTKFFGDILGHSIWFTPILGLLFAITSRLLIKNISLLKTWILFSCTVLFGHLLIDYIGNGVALLYPLMQEEFDFSIVNRNDFFIISTLIISVIIGLVIRKGKIVILGGLLVVSIYIGCLSFSKVQLEQALERQYQSENITLLLTYPSHNFKWGFQVRTKESMISGVSPIFSKKINVERERNISD